MLATIKQKTHVFQPKGNRDIKQQSTSQASLELSHQLIAEVYRQVVKYACLSVRIRYVL